MGSNVRDLVTLINEAYRLTLIQFDPLFIDKLGICDPGKIGSGSWDPFLSDRKGCCTKRNSK
ncbi:Protein Ycf2 [Bienertia sinuspersici]